LSTASNPEKVRQKSGTAVKKCGERAVNRRGIGGEIFSGQTAAPLCSEQKCFSFCFLLILDEGGFRGGRAESAYSSLAAAACQLRQYRQNRRGKGGRIITKQLPASLQSRAYRADLDSKWFPTVTVAEYFETLCNVEFQGAFFGSFGKIHNFSVLQ
jgi:hypothetical protein